MVDPRRTSSAQWAHGWLSPDVGSDVALANAVARELMNQGVPAANVRIDAVGDSQPVYYESMPRGEEGNRRAEIYVQS